MDARNIQKFWKTILEIKDGDLSEAFQHLKTFVYTILTISEATVNVEHISHKFCDLLKKKNNNDCTNFVQSERMKIKLNTEI